MESLWRPSSLMEPLWPPSSFCVTVSSYSALTSSWHSVRQKREAAHSQFWTLNKNTEPRKRVKGEEWVCAVGRSVHLDTFKPALVSSSWASSPFHGRNQQKSSHADPSLAPHRRHQNYRLGSLNGLWTVALLWTQETETYSEEIVLNTKGSQQNFS